MTAAAAGRGVQILRGGIPLHRLVLGAGLRHALATLLVAVQTTVLGQGDI